MFKKRQNKNLAMMMLENEEKEDKGIWQTAKSKSNYKHKEQSKNYF